MFGENQSLRFQITNFAMFAFNKSGNDIVCTRLLKDDFERGWCLMFEFLIFRLNSSSKLPKMFALNSTASLGKYLICSITPFLVLFLII